MVIVFSNSPKYITHVADIILKRPTPGNMSPIGFFPKSKATKNEVFKTDYSADDAKEDTLNLGSIRRYLRELSESTYRIKALVGNKTFDNDIDYTQEEIDSDLVYSHQTLQIDYRLDATKLKYLKLPNLSISRILVENDDIRELPLQLIKIGNHNSLRIKQNRNIGSNPTIHRLPYIESKLCMNIELEGVYIPYSVDLKASNKLVLDDCPISKGATVKLDAAHIWIKPSDLDRYGGIIDVRGQTLRIVKDRKDPFKNISIGNFGIRNLQCNQFNLELPCCTIDESFCYYYIANGGATIWVDNQHKRNRIVIKDYGKEIHNKPQTYLVINNIEDITEDYFTVSTERPEGLKQAPSPSIFFIIYNGEVHRLETGGQIELKVSKNPRRIPKEALSWLGALFIRSGIHRETVEWEINQYFGWKGERE